MTQRSAFVLRIRARQDRRVRGGHRNVWPEMLQAFRDAGIRNSRSSRDDNRVFGYFDADDLESAGAFLDSQERDRSLAGRDGGHG